MMEYEKSYLGDEPFVFVSYAAKDAERVLPLIEIMQKNGYRVWYDEGITPGTQWDERIAARVSAASCVMAALSAAYFESENCIDELKYSRDLEKPLVLLNLEDVNLMGGMALRVGRHPKINYHEDAGEVAFIAELARIDILRVCHENGAKSHETAQTTSRKPVKLIAVALAVLALLAGIFAVGFGDKEEEISEPTPTEIVYPIVEVVDNDLLTATVVGIVKDAEHYTMQVEIRNKSGEKLFYSMDDAYIDGALCNLDLWGELAAEETQIIPFNWKLSELELYNILYVHSDVTVIEGKLLYSLQPEEEFQSADLIYYPLGEEHADTVDIVYNLDRAQDATGVGDLAADTDLINVVTGKHWREDDGSLHLEMYFHNQTEYVQTVVVNVEMINGVPMRSSYEFMVEPGRVHREVLTNSGGVLIAEGEQVVYSGTVEVHGEDGSEYVSQRFGLLYY